MTTAILSFRTAGQVCLHCTRPAIDETRPLDDPPFAAWASEYAVLGSLVGIADLGNGAEVIERMITLGLVDLTLPASNRPGADAESPVHEREIAVNPLAVPPAIAATRPVLDDAVAQVARTALRPLRTVWNAAVHARALRECRELTRLAMITADATTLAEVAGPVAASIARTNARGAFTLAIAVETSETLWPDADELRLMADACQTAGHPGSATCGRRR